MEHMAHRARLSAAIALAALASACSHSVTGPLLDLSGPWVGQADVWTPDIQGNLPTYLAMTLIDSNGRITGTGGGADCRFFPHCDSFGSFTVNGSHDADSIRLVGISAYGPTWTLVGKLNADGSLGGTGRGSTFQSATWSMARVTR
jgi:hypothetical protein